MQGFEKGGDNINMNNYRQEQDHRFAAHPKTDMFSTSTLTGTFQIQV